MHDWHITIIHIVIVLYLYDIVIVLSRQSRYLFYWYMLKYPGFMVGQSPADNWESQSIFKDVQSWHCHSHSCPIHNMCIHNTMWLFNIAMENLYTWRFLAGKIIYKWAIYTMAMLNNQRVYTQWWRFEQLPSGKLT